MFHSLECMTRMQVSKQRKQEYVSCVEALFARYAKDVVQVVFALDAEAIAAVLENILIAAPAAPPNK